jgi:hypothetical protein
MSGSRADCRSYRFRRACARSQQRKCPAWLTAQTRDLAARRQRLVALAFLFTSTITSLDDGSKSRLRAGRRVPSASSARSVFALTLTSLPRLQRTRYGSSSHGSWPRLVDRHDARSTHRRSSRSRPRADHRSIPPGTRAPSQWSRWRRWTVALLELVAQMSSACY